MYLNMIDGKEWCILVRPRVFNYRNVLYVVPAGFKFNGANIPWWAWSLIGLHPFHKKVRRAALFHDFMYAAQYKSTGDLGFKSMLKEDGCNVFQYMACYWAVRLFGGR